MQSAAAEGRSRVSPSTMDKAEESAKKARLNPPNVHVKQELAPQEPAAGGAIVAAAAHSPRVELAVRMEKSVLHCPICTLPFKPPVFQCKGGHLACGGCVAQLPRGQCRTCVDGGGFFDPCPAMDAVVSSTTIECPHDGCQRYVTYHDIADHQSACPHAPCHCTEPGCGFVGAPQALAGHLHTVHSVPVRRLQYRKVSELHLPVSAPRLLLLGEDDNRVFLLTVGTLGATAAAVSVLCARAEAATRPRFTCKMWVDMPPAANRADKILVEMQLRSKTSPGAVVAADEPTFLAVPRMYQVPIPAAGGDGDGGTDGTAMEMEMEITLHIRIDKATPWSD